MKTLLVPLGGLAALYVLVVLVAYQLQDRMLFFPAAVPAETRARLKPHAVQFGHGGTTLHGWLVRREDAVGLPFLIYHGGNGEEVSPNADDFRELPLSGFLLMNYRGYGDSGGEPSGDALRGDAVAVYDELIARERIDPGRIVVMGRSLGSGVATHLAARRPVAGLLLVTPFDRLGNVAAHHYPFLPVRALLRHEMDSAALAPRITATSLVVLAEDDRTVPPRLGRRLFDALPEPKELVTVVGAGHNDIGAYPAYWRAVEDFLATLPRED